MSDGSHAAQERLADAAMLIGLLEYDRADEEIRAVLIDAEQAGDDALASRAYEALGMIATRRGREAEARRLLTRALELAGAPDPVEREVLYWELARVCSGLGEPDRSVEILERAVSLFDEDADLSARIALQLALSYAHMDRGAYGRASDALAELIQRGAEDLDARSRGRINYARGRLSLALGRGDQAIEYTGRAVDDHREAGYEYGLADALMIHAHALLDGSQTEAAAAALAEARALYGPRPSAVDIGFLQTEQGRYHLQRAEYELAIDSVREAIELLGDLSMVAELGDAYLVLARAYDEVGELESADRAYTTAIDLLQRHRGWYRELAKAYRWYGKFLRRTDRPAAAMEMLERAGDISLQLQEMLKT